MVARIATGILGNPNRLASSLPRIANGRVSHAHTNPPNAIPKATKSPNLGYVILSNELRNRDRVIFTRLFQLALP
jgi:hypothetical protein